MGNIIRRVQNQTLVYWAPKGVNSHGEPTWHSPEQLTCRWDDKRIEVIDDAGSPQFSRVELITEVLLDVGGVVCLGTLNTISYWADPKQNLKAYEVIKASATPDFKARRMFYEAWA